MQTLRKAQLLIFERMNEFQRGTMQSQLAFVTSQIAKLIFKDTFIIMIFFFPIEHVSNMVDSFFALTQDYNLLLSILTAVVLVSFLLIASAKCSFMQVKLNFLVQMLAPWLDIFAMLIVTVNIQLLLINFEKDPALAAFNILSIIAISLIQIFYNLFNFTKEPRSDNLFKKRESQVVTFCNIAMLFLSYYLAVTFFRNEVFPKGEALIFSFLQFAASMLKIKQRIFLQYFLSPFSQTVSSLFFFVELYLSLLVLVIQLLGLELIAANVVFILSSMTLLSYSALNSYISRRNSDMFLSSAADLKEEDQAILYLDRLCDLITKVQRQEEDIILVSLKKKHSLTCKNAQCYCQRREFDLGDFIKEYVRTEILQITQIFHNSPSILISVLYFKMVIYKYYPQILARLNYYSTHFSLSLTQRYYRYCLTQYVAKFIKKRNFQIDAVDSEHMFKLEELRGELENIITGEIEVRSKKWKYLSRGLCRVSQLEHSCNISLRYISRLMQIFQEHKSVFKKSKQFNLLFLFYFIKVSFLNNGKEIKENLKQLYFGYKEDELYTIKEFKKFIYHKRSCVIETIIDTKIMGIVTAASRNVEEMFGFPLNKIIGISINNLMPQFMAEEHVDILADWAISGTWRTIGKLKEIYCVHKEQYCFSALLYLKIYIKDNTMHFITNIFKLNENDYLVINPNMKIEGLGRKFLKLLGESSKKMSLELLIENGNSILSQETYAQGKTHRKIFLSLKNLEREVDEYLENINMKFDEQQRNKINIDFHEKIRSISQEKYFVQFTIKRYHMGKINFIVIGLKEAKKIDKLQSIKNIEKSPNFLQNKSNDILDYEVVSSEESSFEKDENDDDIIIQQNANSSLTSMSEKENYPLSKTMQKFINFVQFPQKIQDTRLSKFNILMVVLLVALSVMDFISYYCYDELLIEISEVFFADGAQSDVLQSTEIGYGFIYMLRSQLTDTSVAEFNSTLQSARLVNKYVYSLREVDFASLVTNATKLTKDRLYSYLEKPTTWQLHNQPVQVITHQFLENMYYFTTKIVNHLERLKAKGSTTINMTYFQQLFNNFPEMQRLSEFYLDNYEETTNRQLSILNFFTISSMVLYLILSLILAITLNNYFKFRFDQLIQSFTFFSYIPGQYFQKMRDYYSQLITVVVDRDVLKAIDVHEDEVFEIDTFDLFRKDNSSKNSHSSKVKFINYENYYKWIFIFLVFCLVNGLNYLATYQIRQFFPVSQSIISEINGLLRSENRLLESYFDLRSAYTLNPNSFINQTLCDRLLSYLNDTDSKYNNFANKITTVFGQYDPDFEHSFINTLVTNVCQLTAPFLTSYENAKCISELKLNILDGGILISMNFFERNVLTTLEDLKQQYLSKNASVYSGDYFKQSDFVELDKMLIYMFKVFQQSQATTYASFINTIQIITSSYLKLTLGMTAFFILILLIWLKSISPQKESLSFLYGHLLLIPFMILKTNTRITSSLKEAIEYSDN